jgi:hypothetical protein
MDSQTPPDLSTLVAGFNVADLARELAIRLDPDSLLDSVDVAAMLRVTPEVFLRDYATSVGFPKAYRLTKKVGRGHPRWKRREITAWIDAHANGASKRGGRPRKTD